MTPDIKDIPGAKPATEPEPEGVPGPDPGANEGKDGVKKEAKTTAYHVLLHDGSGLWNVVRENIEATSATAAKIAVATSDDHPGTYIAVPSRSWNPQKLGEVTSSRYVVEAGAEDG